MPAKNIENIRHLLRRTEFVDRPSRVDELNALPSIEACVDNVLAVDTSPPSASFAGIDDNNWLRGEALTYHWLDRMATAPRPFGERMAFFWHGHICSELGKVGSAELMREQIDLFRSDGVNGNVSDLAKEMLI